MNEEALICDWCHKDKDELLQRVDWPGVREVQADGSVAYRARMICNDCIPFPEEDDE